MAGPDFEARDLDPQKQLRQVFGVIKQSWFTIFTFTRSCSATASCSCRSS